MECFVGVVYLDLTLRRFVTVCCAHYSKPVRVGMYIRPSVHTRNNGQKCVGYGLLDFRRVNGVCLSRRRKDPECGG